MPVYNKRTENGRFVGFRFSLLRKVRATGWTSLLSGITLTLGILHLGKTRTLAENTNIVNWGTFDPITDPLNEEIFFWGLDLTGSSNKEALARNVYASTTSTTVSTKGDLVELGYFASDATGTPSATQSNLFLGDFWIPLTSTTKIGMRSENGGTVGGDEENTAGRILAQTTFTDKDSGAADEYNDAVTFPLSTYKVTDTNPHSGANLNAILTTLDNTDGGTGGSSPGNGAFLAIRFYDVKPASNSVGGEKSDVTTGNKSRYNTVASAAWKWAARGTLGSSQDIQVSLTDIATGNIMATGGTKSVGGITETTTLLYELPNETYSSTTIGTDGVDLSTLGDSTANNGHRTATIAYRDGTALNLANTGDAIVSMLDDSVNITGDGSNERVLAIMAQGGNVYAFGGDITNKTDIVKIGAGEQEFTAAITTEGTLSIDEGTMTLKPAGNTNRHFEYITDDGSPGILKLDNSAGADAVVELGFASTTTAKTFGGNVASEGSGENVIKVASGRTDADYGKEQIFSGVISGSAKVTKTGVGRLNLTGNNVNTGDVDINDGTLVVGHANALGDTPTVTIDKGKLEVASGITTTNAVTIQGGSGRNFIGGDGTVDSVIIGSAANQVDVVSPGQGFSTSLNLANKQAVRGNTAGTATTADDAAASIGSFTATSLSLLNGGVFDWEIKDFNDGGTPGTEWDLLNFDRLVLGAKTDRFTINVLGIKSANGAAAAPAWGSSIDNADLWAKGGSTFKFLEGGTAVDWDGTLNGGGTQWSATEIDDYFAFRTDDLAYATNMWGGDWSVSYSGGDFYLNFSAVPEPSTYVMVTGLFLLPGFRFLKRFRRRKDKGGE